MRAAGSARPIAFLLPGQGSQHPQMAAGLYAWEPGFTEAIDTVFAALGADGTRLRDDWLAEEPGVPIDHVTRAQPLLFALDYALGAMVRGWGAQPVALLGHSAGELAAGALAGVLRPQDAAQVMWDRAHRLAAMPPGGMLVVAASVEELQPYLAGDGNGGGDGDVVVGAVNAPRQTMLAGPVEPLARTTAELRAAGYTCIAVRATTAFHSPALRPACGIEAYAGVKLAPPAVPIRSAYTTGLLTAETATDPWFWAAHPVEPVLFWPALDGLLADGGLFLVETGPGQGLSALARRHRCVRTGQSAVFPLLPALPKGPEEDRRQLLRAVEALRAEGHALPGFSEPGSSEPGFSEFSRDAVPDPIGTP